MCGAAEGWPVTPAVTDSPDGTLCTEIVSPVIACLATALSGPGQIWNAELAYGSELSSGAVDADGPALAAGDGEWVAAGLALAGAAGEGAPVAGALAAGLLAVEPPARDGATAAARPVHPCQASSSPAMPVTASRAIPHRPTGSPPSRMSAFHVCVGAWHDGIVAETPHC